MTMYLEHFGLREAPFRITPHTEFFFAGANRGATLDALVYAITAGEGLVKVTGEVGTGKTMLCRVLMERLPDSVATIYLAVPSLDRDEILVAIASELGIDTRGASTTQRMRALQERLIALHAEGRKAVALIDEAHAMPLATLEEIRLLSNLETGREKLLQIALFGQPELDEHLNLPNMRQLRERITHAFGLAPLPPKDIRDYVDFRLRAAGYRGPDLFGADALRVIADASEGLTRRINIYADKTLLAAFATGTHTITADHARAAVSDTQIVVRPRAGARRLATAGAAGLAAGIAIGYGSAVWLHSRPEREAVPVPPASAAPAAKPAAQPTASLPAASAAPDASAPQPPQPLEAKVTGASRLDTLIAEGIARLDRASGGPFVVQLMMTDAADRAHLGSYVEEASRVLKPEEIFLFPSGSTQSPRVGVLYGAFPTRQQANEAIGALPGTLRQFRPYVRTVEGVRGDLRREPAT